MWGNWAVPVLASILILGTFGLQFASAETVTIDQGTTVSVDSGAIMTVDSPDLPNTLTNRGTLNVGDTGKLIITNEGNWLNDCTGVSNLASTGIVEIGSAGSLLSTLTNHGIINGPGQINFFGTTIEVKNSGIITALLNPITTIIDIIDPCVSGGGTAIGGTLISIDTTALLLAGAQSSLVWWLPVVVIVGVSAVLFKARRRVKLNE